MNYKIFYHLNSHKIFLYLFLAVFACQIFFWKQTEKHHAPFDLVPPAPNQYLLSALSLGDDEFLFRSLALRFQNSGDVFAGFVALKNYDYLRIYQWMKTLDTLNIKSNLVPSLASYYYSQTQKSEDTRYVINYLDEHSASDVDANWWWLFQAMYIAKINLKDLNVALDIAYKLAKNNVKSAPLWTKQAPAFILAEMGNNCLAFSVIENLIKESQNGARQLSAEEMNFMRHFINDRLTKLKNEKFDPTKCHSKKLSKTH
jgi:hypothetical protein